MVPLPARRAAALAVTTLVAGAATAPAVFAATTSFTIANGPSSPHALAADANRNVYWTMDPSGTTAWAVTSSGTVGGQVPLGFTPTDVEAASVHDGMLYIGDIGDSGASRSSITVYRLANPTYGQGGTYRSWDFAYPDGHHDAAAMMVSPRGNIYVVTRGDNPAIYRSPSDRSSSSVNTLSRVADAPDGVTDATFLTDGRVAMRTANAVLVLDPNTWRTTAQAPFGVQDAGEMLTTDLSASGSLMAGNGTRVDAVQVPTTMASVTPVAGASASASASAQASTDDGDHSTAKQRTGTFLALGGALVVALAAAAVVWFRR